MEEGAKSKTSPVTSETTTLTTATTTATTIAKTVTPASTTVAQLEQPDNLVQEEEEGYQATVNGEFTDRTHTFLSTTITTTTTITTATTTTITTTTTTTVPISPARITTTTTVADPIITLTSTITSTSKFSFIPKHDINHDISKINSNHIILTPALFHPSIDDDDNDDDSDGDDNDNERFVLFWPTMLPFRTQTAIISSSETKKIERVPSMTVPANTSHGNIISVANVTTLNDYRINENDNYYSVKFFNSTPTTSKHFLIHNNISKYQYDGYPNDYSGYYYHSDNNNYSYVNDKFTNYHYPNSNYNYNYFQFLGNNSKCYNYAKSNANYLNCMNATAISTFPASLLQRYLSPPSSSTTAPPTIIKIMQTSSAISEQTNHNYFEDLWSDIAEPSAVIIDSGQNESTNKTTTTTATITPSSSSSSTITHIIHSNQSIKPLTFDTMHTLQSTQQTSPLRKATIPQSDNDNKRFTSATSKVESFLPTISTKSSLAEEGKKRIKGPEIKNWGKFKW